MLVYRRFEAYLKWSRDYVHTILAKVLELSAIDGHKVDNITTTPFNPLIVG
jgi:hypothetical protein